MSHAAVPAPKSLAERTDEQRRSRDDLNAHYHYALTGSLADQAPAAAECAQSSVRLRSLFSPTSTVRTLETWSAARALIRISEDRHNQMLCVYHLGDQPLTFVPSRLLDMAHHSHDELRFVSGEATSSGRDQETLTCHLAPLSYVWLGLFSTPPS